MKRRKIYRVIFSENTYSDADFLTKDEAVEYIQDYRNGFEKSQKGMLERHRAYWRKVGAGMKLFKVEEILTEVKF